MARCLGWCCVFLNTHVDMPFNIFFWHNEIKAPWKEKKNNNQKVFKVRILENKRENIKKKMGEPATVFSFFFLKQKKMTHSPILELSIKFRPYLFFFFLFFFYLFWTWWLIWHILGGVCFIAHDHERKKENEKNNKKKKKKLKRHQLLQKK